MKRIAALLAVAAVCFATGGTVRADAITENTNFVDKVYEDLLQRPASSLEIAGGLNALGSETRTQFALSVDTSSAYYRLLAESYVQGLLGRAATPTELAGFTGQLNSNFSDEFVQAEIASSAEFFQDSGNTNAGFVTALFKDFLKRTPTSSEAAFWVSALGTMSRDQVAALILGSLEYDQGLVQGYYQEFLQRPADSTGLNFFASGLNGASLTDEQVIAALIGTDEYFKLAQPSGGPAPTPEPRTVVLLGLGLASLVLLRRQLG